MILVSKEQANYIRQHSPSSHVATVNRQAKAKKKKRFVEETAITKKLIKEFNEKQNICEDYGEIKRKG